MLQIEECAWLPYTIFYLIDIKYYNIKNKQND